MEDVRRAVDPHHHPAPPSDPGDDATALQSAHTLFSPNGEVLNRRGRRAVELAKLVVVIRNQKIPPFTVE